MKTVVAGRLAVALVGLLATLAATPAMGAVQLQPVLAGLDSPLYVAQPRDGSGRLFVVEQPGRIKLLAPGSAVPTGFLDITDRVLSGGERGLLGLAFHPRFPSNGRFFVNYTRRPDGATVITEFKVARGNPSVADPASEVMLLLVAQPFPNHNGGGVEFGPDGFLYIGLGDGGAGNDPGNRAQNVDDLLGKMLRIDVDRPAGPGLRYSSPPSNPFVGAGRGRPEVFALGLRNPFRFSFDRATGELWAGDVGQNAIEEIDVVTAGGNYGWRVFEGTRCTGLGPASCTTPGFIPPVAEYRHTGGRCSVTGGYVYRGRAGSLPVGSYVYGDFCSGEIFLLENGTQRVLVDTRLRIASFGEDEAGEIYVVGLDGTVHRLINR
jgi:glucose/arabinose dehydrogenase